MLCDACSLLLEYSEILIDDISNFKACDFFVVTMTQWAQIGGQVPFSKNHDIIYCFTFITYESQDSAGLGKIIYYHILKI